MAELCLYFFQERILILFIGLIPPHSCACPFFFLEVVGVIHVIGDIFNHHCLNLFSLIF